MKFYIEKVSLGQWDIVDEDGNTFACLIKYFDSENGGRVKWLLTDTDLRRLHPDPFSSRMAGAELYAAMMGRKFSSSRVRPKVKKPR
jgi:hypothetical protein